MNNCLITGATGLIGLHLLPYLVKKYNVFVLMRKENNDLLLKYKCTPVLIDLNSNWGIDQLPSSMDYIIHLAMADNYNRFSEYDNEIANVNTISTLKLLNYAKKSGVKTFIFGSTGGIDNVNMDNFNVRGKITNDTDNLDLDFYIRSKLSSEILASAYSAFMSIIILRFYFIYGPGQKKSMLIANLVKKVLNMEPIPLDGKDGIKINPTYVQDAVKYIIRSLNLHGSYRFNIAGKEIINIKKICKIIGNYLKINPVFTVKSDKKNTYVADIYKTGQIFRIKHTPFNEGIKKYIKSL